MDIPESYADTLDKLQSAPNCDEVPGLIATVSTRLLDQGDGEAAAVVDGLVFAMQRVAGLLKTPDDEQHCELGVQEACRIASSMTGRGRLA